MDKRCTVCNHSQAHEINLALLGGDTLDTLKQQFGLSRSALQRHKQHLQRTIAQAEDRLRHNFLLSYLFQLNDYNAAAAATVVAARAEGDARLTLQAVNAGTRIINTMARFGVDLDHETIYRLITSREYLQPGSLLPGDPQILTGPRAALVRSLATACPETAPDDLFDPEAVAASLQPAQEPDVNPPLSQARPLEFPGFLLPSTDVLPAAASDPNPAPSAQQPEEKPVRCVTEPAQPSFLAFNGKPKTADRKPFCKRDRCGTDAVQTPPLSKLNEENQMDIQEEKISGTNLAARSASDPLPTALCLLPTASLTPVPWSLRRTPALGKPWTTPRPPNWPNTWRISPLTPPRPRTQKPILRLLLPRPQSRPSRLRPVAPAVPRSP